MTTNSILPLLTALAVSPLSAEETDAKDTKKEQPASVGVLRPKDPTGEPLPLKYTEAAAKAAMRNLYQIWQALLAFTSEGGEFPEGKSSNEAFRQLFLKGLIDDEKLFYLGSAENKDGQPDGDIGTEKDGYKAALAPGECSFYYISGLTSDRDDSSLPIAYTKLTGEEEGLIYVIVVRVGGYCKVYKTTDGIVKDMRGGKMVDILSEEYGTNPGNIVAPLAKEKEKEKAKEK